MEMNFAALEKASEGEELNPLAYNPDDYPDMQDMITFIERHGHEPANTPTLESLMLNGVIKAEDMELYLADRSDASSELKEVLKTPAHYKLCKDEKQRKIDEPDKDEPEKKFFELGTFSHSAVLEPELFKKVKVEPKHSLASKPGVSSLIRFYEGLNNYTGVDFSEWKIDEMKKYLQSLKDKCIYQMIEEEHEAKIQIMDKNQKAYGNGIIAKILKGALIEHSFYGTDSDTGRAIKLRPDAINFEENIGVNAIISVKTTSAQTTEKFERDCANFKYDMSDAMYLDGASNITGRKFNTVITIMLQTVAPFLTAVFWSNPEDLMAGHNKYKTALKKVQQCTLAGSWPGFEQQAAESNHGIIDMQLPDWSKKILAPVE